MHTARNLAAKRALECAFDAWCSCKSIPFIPGAAHPREDGEPSSSTLVTGPFVRFVGALTPFASVP